MRRGHRRGVSTGTIFMLTLTSLVLIGFFALLPTLTGNTDISTNAMDLAVKLDQSFSQLINAQTIAKPNKPSNTAIAPLTTPAQTPAPTVTPQPVKRFSLCAAGSIQLDSSALSSLTDKDIGYRFDLLLQSVAPMLRSDLTIATLKNLVIPTDKLTSTNMPIDLLNAMNQAGIDAVSVNQLNAFSSGLEGLAATKSSIAAAGMTPYGLYANQQERDTAVIGTANGVRIGLLGYQNDLSSTSKTRLSKEEAVFAYAPLEIETIQNDIARLRNSGAEVVVVSLCWGKPKATSPTDAQREQAQQIADAGADIILGTNPQAVMPVEIITAQRSDGKYHPVLCAYSLGNLFTYDRESRTNLAGILLHADVQYDPTTGTVAFDNLSYDPTYCWRGKMDDATRTAVLSAHEANAPEYIDQKQLDIMKRCYTLISDVMKDTVLKER